MLCILIVLEGKMEEHDSMKLVSLRAQRLCYPRFAGPALMNFFRKQKTMKLYKSSATNRMPLMI